jgi:uncharacterized membrane protein HdeD (DUF308 family)
LTITSSTLAIVVGVSLLFYPVGSSVTFVWLVGLMALIDGSLSVARACDLRKTFRA